MDDKFKKETERLSKVATNQDKRRTKIVDTTPDEDTPKCPRCGNHVVTIENRCTTCDLETKWW